MGAGKRFVQSNKLLGGGGRALPWISIPSRVSNNSPSRFTLKKLRDKVSLLGAVSP